MIEITAIELYYHDGGTNHVKVGDLFNGEQVVNIHAPGGMDYPAVTVSTPNKRYVYKGVPFMAVEERRDYGAKR